MNRKLSGCMLVILGASIANVIVVAGAFTLGTIFGCDTPVVMHPNGGGQVGPMKFGLAGGATAVGWVALLYIFTFGVVPLIVSVAGAACALGIRWLLPALKRFRGSATFQTESE
ncbi:MAG: hypothetical protein U0941_10830 [Planctomycetaceae bacterium]